MMTNPLIWPDEKPRTLRREWSRFSVTLHAALLHLQQQIRLMGGTDVIITSNGTLTKGGQIAAQQKSIEDPGVAVWLTVKGMEVVFACDLFHSLRENIRAVGKIVEYLRKLEELGGGYLEAALVGFEVPALPSGSGSSRPWWEVLGVARDAPFPDIKQAYLRLAKQTHSDIGGYDEAFREVQDAYQEAESERQIKA